VGKQLETIPNVTVSASVKYQDKKNSKESIDWFLETPNYLFLIEVKASTLPLSARLGSPKYREILGRVITEAADQIDKTADQLTQENPSFGHFPKKELRGIIVTLDEYYFSSRAFGLKAPVIPQTGVPKAVVPIVELELFAAYSQKGNAEKALDGYFDTSIDRKEPRSFFSKTDLHDNPILSKCHEDIRKRIEILNTMKERLNHSSRITGNK
jgi:hypothetical protein